MKPLVTAVVVALGDSEYLKVTLAALRNQTRPVERLIVVDTSADRALSSLELRSGESLIQTGTIKNLAAALAACQPLELPSGSNGLDGLDGSNGSEQNWLWLLHDDSAPTASALEILLSTAEISPSVAIVGPKLVDWNNPRRIQQLGLTLTPSGDIFSPVANELDQAQHDHIDDVLAVSTAGMLIRTDVYQAVGGLDAGAPNLAADVELCVRVRRAGHRVAVAPTARVAHAGLSLAGKRPRQWLGAGPRTALRRANAHLRIAYSPLLVALLSMLFAPLIGVLRAAWAIASKHPNRIWAELSTGFWVFFTGFARLAGRARANRRALIVSSNLRSLRATRAQLRQHRLNEAAQDDQALDAEARPLLQDGAVETSRSLGERLTFSGAGGVWFVVALIALSLRLWPTNGAAIGGGALPLSADWYTLFTHAGSSYQQIGLGFYGPSDPFNWVLLGFGSLTPWQPSLGLAIFLLLAKAIAFVGAWRALSLITARAWLRNLGALAFALWPALSQAQLDARIPAVVAIVALPWLTFAVARAAGLGKHAPRRSASRTWSWVGVAGLLLLAVGASAPNLLPALFAAIVVVLFTRLRRFGYLFWTPLPLAAVLAPLVWFEVVGLLEPLTTLADPGVALPNEPAQFWQLLLGGSIGAAKALFGAGAYSIWFTAPVLLIAVLATLSKRFVFAASLWLLVLGAVVSAWLVQRLDFAAVGVGSSTTALERVNGSPSALLGLAAMGLIGLLVVALDQFGSRAWRAIAATSIALLMVLPSAAAFAVNAPSQRFVDGRVVPSIVAAETARGSQLKTLVLRDTGFDANGQRKLTAELVSGDGIQLDDLSLAYRFALAGLAGQRAEYGRVGQLVADLSSSNNADLTKPLQDAGIGYVLLPEVRSAGGRQLAIALQAADELESVGKTEYGQLWRVKHPNPKLAVAPESVPSPWSVTKIIQLIVIAAFVLLAIPGRSTGVGGRRESEIFVGQTDEPTGGDEFD